MNVDQAVVGTSPDPYQLRPEDVTEAPRTFRDALRKTGPGMILAASIVGSGELITTTTLGAEVGYVALWVILLSCVIKPAVQAAMGRFVIATGETGLASFDRVPGPRWKVSWVVWCWAIMVFMTLLQVGAMFGGVAQVMNLIFPAVPVKVWVLGFLALTLALLLGGGYDRVERIATIKVGLFTLVTLLAAVVLMRQPEFDWGDLAGGLTFELPGAGLATAVAVFGITGVGAAELFMYPYWCVEKGYARFAGRRDSSPEWRRRARGWVRVMHLDIFVSMMVYTVATIAFYLLGAGVLHGMGRVPKGNDMISALSNIYTQTLGGWSLLLFYAGAIATLYSTIFAATAAHSRLFADLCRLMGLFAADDYRQRLRYRRGWVIALTVVPVALYWLFESPVKMVVAGGVAQALMLPIIGVSVVYLQHRYLPKELLPSRASIAALWGVAAVIVLLMGYYVIGEIRKL